MKRKYLKYTKLTLFLVTLSVFSVTTQAALVIDDFTDQQSITDNANSGATTSSPFVISGTELGAGTRRTLSAEVAGSGAAKTEIDIVDMNGAAPGGGLMGISNNSFSTGGTASLFWDGFTPNNFTAVGNAILLKVISIDLGVTVEMIINGTASSGIQSFTGPGDFFVLFSNFTNPSAFNAATSVELKFSGARPWDGQFSLLVVDDPATVPEPSVLVLMLSAFTAAGVMAKHRKKKQS